MLKNSHSHLNFIGIQEKRATQQCELGKKKKRIENTRKDVENLKSSSQSHVSYIKPREIVAEGAALRPSISSLLYPPRVSQILTADLSASLSLIWRFTLFTSALCVPCIRCEVFYSHISELKKQWALQLMVIETTPSPPPPTLALSLLSTMGEKIPQNVVLSAVDGNGINWSGVNEKTAFFFSLHFVFF